MTHRPPTCAKRWKRKRIDQNRSDQNQKTWKSRVRVRVVLVPTQPEPDAGEDDGHPKNTTHRLEGRRAAEEGQMGTRTHIITEIEGR
jgi:hypothetical protein